MKYILERSDYHSIDFYLSDDAKYTLNNDGTYDVIGDVDFSNHDLSYIPFKFKKVTGDFSCHDCGLKSLYNCPIEVGGYFNCSYNKLTNLIDGPEIVGNTYLCSHNKIESLEGAPREINGHFNCFHNSLKGLEGSPVEVYGNFNCSNNKLESLEHMPLEIGGDFFVFYNDLKELDSISNIEGKIVCDEGVDASKFRGYCKEIIFE
jgi:hypothetical protein